METSRGFMDSAWRWGTKSQGFTPTVFDLRGAIVMAYYAVFHRLAEVCADELVGDRADHVRTGRAWNAYYRSLDHKLVRQACEKKKLDELFSSVVKTFCHWFPNLQDVRVLSSYEALIEPTLDEANVVLSTAEDCIECLDRLGEDERKDFVAWMMLQSKEGVNLHRTKNLDYDPSFFQKFTEEKSRV